MCSSDLATGSRDELGGFVQVGVAKADQPHYLRVVARPDHDPDALIGYGLAVIGARIRDGGRRGPGHHGVLSAIRTYEAPLDRHLEEAGFRGRSHVTILLKEALVRVAQPALLPAVR